MSCIRLSTKLIKYKSPVLALICTLISSCVSPHLEQIKDDQNDVLVHLYEETGEIETLTDTTIKDALSQTNDQKPTTVKSTPPYILKGLLILPEGKSVEGSILIKNGNISKIRLLESTDRTKEEFETEQIPVIETQSIISPGFIDLHNHVPYNFVPLWRSNRRWRDRYEWAANDEYKRAVKKPYNKMKQNRRLFLEMNLYGEIRALVGGATSILGASNRSLIKQVLVRNIDHEDPDLVSAGIPGDVIRTNVLSVSSYREKAPELIKQLANQSIRAAFFHISEGKTDSRNEFQVLQELGLVRRGIVITHGTALEPPEFEKMAEANMSLVWSPRSNLELYGTTTDISNARTAGITIALAPDWSPSGSDNILSELKCAASYLQSLGETTISYKELVEMITINPAKIAGLSSVIGKIEEGYIADLVVLKKKDLDPYKSIALSSEADIDLVIINGRPIYGNIKYLKKFTPLEPQPIPIGRHIKYLNPKQINGEVLKYRTIKESLQSAYSEFGTIAPLTANKYGEKICAVKHFTN